MSMAVILVVIGAASYFVFKKSIKKNPVETEIVHSECLGKDEVASYKINEKGLIGTDVIIEIKNKTDGNVLFSFVINGIFRSYHPIELHVCGVYVMRMFNYDDDKVKQGNYDIRMELWKYDYTGNGFSLILLADYSYDFRVDPQEVYVSLERGYSGKENYALVVKDFNNNIDEFILSRESLTQSNPEFISLFRLEDWTKDGSYFWARLSAGAYTDAFLRIKRNDWKVEVLPAPSGVLGGTALNVDKGYVTQLPGHVWTGIDVATEEVKKEWIKQGKISQLYLFNLLSRNRILLATTTEPLWSFNTQWISDTELQYGMPNGEKKIYTINEK